MTPSVLNPEQEEAVMHVDGPLRVGAVAGSGKTTALIERVAYLVEKKRVHPDSILLISFSVAAKNEIKKRIEKRLPGANAGTCARTFHSIGLNIYKSETENDQKEIDSTTILWLKTMRAAYTAVGVEPEKKALKRFAGLVKNNLLGTHESLRRLGRVDSRMVDLAEQVCETAKVTPDELLSAFFKAEEIRTRSGIDHNGAIRTFLTFDDMIYEAAMLLKREDVRRRWGSRWRYVMQDEAQDENHAQNAIATALCSEHRNYMVVGDPSQSIYGWRGATPEKMLSFEDDWPGAKTVLMHRNYRSGVEIVDLANRIMDHMPANTVIADDLGTAVTMTSERNTHGYIGYHLFENAKQEAENVADNIVAHQEEGVAWKDQCILLRMNRMTRDVEIALALRKVPYKLLSGTSFFGMKEARIIFGYLRLMLNRASEEDLASAIAPVRGLGKAFVDAAVEAKQPEDGWLDAIRKATLSLRPYQARFANEWLAALKEQRKSLGDRTPHAAVVMLRSVFRLNEYFAGEEDDSEDSRAKENLDAVSGFAASFPDASEMLDLIDEVEEHSKKNVRKRDVVRVSTIHKCKGSEWKVVYLVQLADGSLPAARADLTEERRVFYVAATRAHDELWLSYSLQDANGEPADPSLLATEAGLKVHPDKYYPKGRVISLSPIGTQMGLALDP